MEIRQEDLGKMMLKQADVLDDKVINDVLVKFFTEHRNGLYLLYSKDLNYFTVLRNKSLLAEQSVEKYMDFAKTSFYFVETGEKVMENFGMEEIVEIEYNQTLESVELWIGKGNPHYFQLMPWDDSSVII